MKITKHAQSCLLVETTKAKVLVDPGNYVFEGEGLDPTYFPNIDILIITHEHRDHCDLENVPMIIQTSQPVVLATDAVIELLKEQNPSADYRVTGNGTTHDFTSLGLTIYGYDSYHGPLPNGKPAPAVSGVVIDDGQTRFYIPGDTISFNSEVKDIDIVAVPICGVVAFNINQAKTALLDLHPRVAIPYHFDNPSYPVRPADFVETMEGTTIKVNLLKNGKSFTWGSYIK